MKFNILILILKINLCLTQTIGNCASKIYCHGELLHTIQMSQIFKDSKTFVDMPTKYSESGILFKFSLVDPKNLTKLKQFLDENFHPSGIHIVQTSLEDWSENPVYLSKIKNFNLRHFASHLHSKWRKLSKKFDDSQLCPKCDTSAFFSRKPFIVPGGRFIEYYYWDTYWVIKSLLISDMHMTVKGILKNFFDILELNGFIPNGAQKYYLNRSQPPLFIQMVYSYFKHTKDLAFLKSSIHLLDKEYEFWMRDKSIEINKNGKKFLLNQYRVLSDLPRPEAYWEDFTNGLKSENSSRYYSNVMAAAESGWDFSSRWFKDPMDIKTILIDKIIPVDLNSIMYQNEKIMHELHDLLGNVDKSKIYKSLSELRHEAINNVFWSPDLKTYGDYNLDLDKLNSNFLYITDLSPLWFGVVPPINEDIILERYKYILYDYLSGVPASNVKTNQQWDFPNVWAPYHDWIVNFMLKSNRVSEALNIAQRFINTVYCGWIKTGQVFEKYKANETGKIGYGGEYVVQEGFGWTNAIVIILMNQFGSSLKTFCT